MSDPELGRLNPATKPKPTNDWDAWRDSVVESLDGRPFETLLVDTYEGITLQPLYRSTDTAELSFTWTNPGTPPYVRGINTSGYLHEPWLIAQDLSLSTPQEVNGALRDGVQNGLTAVNIVMDTPTREGRDPVNPDDNLLIGRTGLSLALTEDWDDVLAEIDSRLPLSVDAGTAALPVFALLAAHMRVIGQDTADMTGRINADPLATLVETGTLPCSIAEALDEMADLTLWAAQRAPQLGTITVSTTPYHDAGANAVQELAFMLATAVQYIREMAERGLPLETVVAHMRVEMSVGPQLFMEIAKLRTARLLWSQLIAAFGGDAAVQRLHLYTRTSHLNQSLIEPTVNELRATTAALAAILGGTTSLIVSPHDAVAGSTTQFSRRIARNVQHILRDEVHLSRLVDPAGGTWAVESLVNDLAQKSWHLFQSLESMGGMRAAIDASWVQTEVNKIHTARVNDLAVRTSALVGTNRFVDLDIEPLTPAWANLAARVSQRSGRLAEHFSQRGMSQERAANLSSIASGQGLSLGDRVELAIGAATMGATLAEITRALRPKVGDLPQVIPLTLRRLSEPFEALHNLAADHFRTTRHPPRAFLANMGPLRQHKARADFVQGFLAVGGFAVDYPAGFTTADEAAIAAAASGADVVVICSTEATYPELVPALAAAIKAGSPATAVLLAGRPGAQEMPYRAAGVDDFIYEGADCLGINERLLQTIVRGDLKKW